jgi:stearoyl-CoA desaturase (delta-9 desaturase)
MLVRSEKEGPRAQGTADISDLKMDPLCALQHRFYLPLALMMSFVVPTVACGMLWGDYWGGYFVAGVARLVFVHHSTFFVNSLAHYTGAATYTDGHTARNSIVTALVTLGEGYHNFHHEFPTDFRNGVEWWQYDPTKLLISFFSLFGMAYELNVFPANEVAKGKFQMAQKMLDAKRLAGAWGSNEEKAQVALNEAKKSVFWGPDPASLVAIAMSDFEAAVRDGKPWCILDGFVLDVGKWAPDHPGGAGLVKSRIGKDITEEFKGDCEIAAEEGYERRRLHSLHPHPAHSHSLFLPPLSSSDYKHSNAGRNVAQTLRIARIEGYWAK